MIVSETIHNLHTSFSLLHIRLLIHRQTLLYYILRRIPDPFQADLAHLCIKGCVMAAYDAIAEVHLLTQKKFLSSSWHNSHCEPLPIQCS